MKHNPLEKVFTCSVSKHKLIITCADSQEVCFCFTFTEPYLSISNGNNKNSDCSEHLPWEYCSFQARNHHVMSPHPLPSQSQNAHRCCLGACRWQQHLSLHRHHGRPSCRLPVYRLADAVRAASRGKVCPWTSVGCRWHRGLWSPQWRWISKAERRYLKRLPGNERRKIFKKK